MKDSRTAWTGDSIGVTLGLRDSHAEEDGGTMGRGGGGGAYSARSNVGTRAERQA